MAQTARALLYISILICHAYAPHSEAASITLAWDPSSDPSVASYNVYYGTSSHSYDHVLATGSQTAVTISNLVPSVTYYFAATTVTKDGLESDYSAETAYTVPSPNQPPTLDPLMDLIINEGAAPVTLNLSGISSGASNELQTLTLSAFSSNPSLIPNPTVDYITPNATGTSTFALVPGSSGSASLTLMVDDGGSVSNTIIRSFKVTVVPVNSPPTLAPLNDLVLSENAGMQTVSLTGISTGSPNEIQPLTVRASSSKPGLIPDPLIDYTSPNPTGTLKLTPVTNTFGSATITVTVSDGQATNSVVTQQFVVTVNQTVVAQATLTNAVVAPNTVFQFVLTPPYASNHKFSYGLGADAPTGAIIVTRKGISSFIWMPGFNQASTTNLFTIQATDKSTSLSTNQSVLIIVLDYVSVRAGSTSVQAGQNGVLPLFLSSSDGATNLTFTLDWPSTRFSNPSLSSVSQGIASSSLQNQGTNLLINFQCLPGQSFQGSNLLGQISFQTSSNQPSAFLNLPVRILSAIKPSAASYVDYAPVAGQVVLVNDLPLLQAGTQNSLSRNLTLYGRVGTTYQLQSSTNAVAASNWAAVFNYKQTNVAQVVNVDGSAPVIFYRVLQQ